MENKKHYNYFQCAVWQEGSKFVALNLNTLISSFGKTRKSAMRNLKEALELRIEGDGVVELSEVSSSELETLEILTNHKDEIMNNISESKAGKTSSISSIL